MKSHAITLLCLLAAFVCYLIGFGFGVELAVVIGGISELIFWVRVSGAVTAPKSEKHMSNN
jgi:hypothetical protein